MIDPTRKNVEYEKELSLLTITQLCERWDMVVENLRNFLHSPAPTIFKDSKS